MSIIKAASDAMKKQHSDKIHGLLLLLSVSFKDEKEMNIALAKARHLIKNDSLIIHPKTFKLSLYIKSTYSVCPQLLIRYWHFQIVEHVPSYRLATQSINFKSWKSTTLVVSEYAWIALIESYRHETLKEEYFTHAWNTARWILHIKEYKPVTATESKLYTAYLHQRMTLIEIMNLIIPHKYNVPKERMKCEKCRSKYPINRLRCPFCFNDYEYQHCPLL
jgi:hypothetical protein